MNSKQSNDLLILKENYPDMDVDRFDEIRQRYLNGKLEIVYDNEIQSLNGTKYMSSYNNLPEIERDNGFTTGYFYNKGVELAKNGKIGMIILNGGVASSYEKELGYRPVKGIFQAIMQTPISFIAIKLHSIYEYQKQGIYIPTYFMNSPLTDKDTRDYLERFNNFNLNIKPKHFCQDLGWPKIDPQTGNIITRRYSGKVSIATKGHGDVYQDFSDSGLYDEFIQHGGEILLICNVDNSEATIDFVIAGYFSWLNKKNSVQVMFESAKQTSGDKKGGKCVLMRRTDGKMGPGILELTRISPQLQNRLLDIEEFNTNTCWLHTSIDRNLFDLPFRAVKKPRLIEVKDPEISETENKEIIQFEHESHKLVEIVELGSSHIILVPSNLRFWPNKYLSDQLSKQGKLIEKYSKLYDWMLELNPQANEYIFPIKEELLI